MKLSEFKNYLTSATELAFVLPNGTLVPPHFHITEMGLLTKNFIDCGGVVREEKVVSFQIWVAEDEDHRLSANKVLDIIDQSEKLLGTEDVAVEVEYQTDTIGKYGLDFLGKSFLLTAKQTDCLAKDHCGVPQKSNLPLADLQTNASSCTPGGGCC